jgi:predicted secreted hydrolase
MVTITQDTDKISYRFLKAEKIVPKDDAFHGDINLIDVEWWYFDGIFDNDYSIHVGIRTYHLKKSGFIESRINIYKKGKVEVEASKRDFFSNFNISYDSPDLEINNNQIIRFDKEYFKKTGKWKYHVSLKINDNEVDLIFVGTTQGWKIETSETCWTVALPKAKVTGEIKFNGETINVQGIGYHDHNWGYTATTILTNIGWFWGRVAGDSLTVTWAKTMITPERGDLLAIINNDNVVKSDKKGYYSINPENISFSAKKFIKKNRQKIPTEFDLRIVNTISDDNFPINADIHMKTYNSQHSRIFTAHYFRYHVKAFGEISLGSKTDPLDNKTQIMEFLSFK